MFKILWKACTRKTATTRIFQHALTMSLRFSKLFYFFTLKDFLIRNRETLLAEKFMNWHALAPMTGFPIRQYTRCGFLVGRKLLSVVLVKCLIREGSKIEQIRVSNLANLCGEINRGTTLQRQQSLYRSKRMGKKEMVKTVAYYDPLYPDISQLVGLNPLSLNVSFPEINVLNRINVFPVQYILDAIQQLVYSRPPSHLHKSHSLYSGGTLHHRFANFELRLIRSIKLIVAYVILFSSFLLKSLEHYTVH